MTTDVGIVRHSVHSPVLSAARRAMARFAAVSAAVVLVGGSGTVATARSAAADGADPRAATADPGASAGLPNRLVRLERDRRRVVRARMREVDGVVAAELARDAAEARLDAAREGLSRHLVELYREGGGMSRMALLLGARDAGGAVERAGLLRQVATHDRAMIEELEQAQADVERYADRVRRVQRGVEVLGDRLGRIDERIAGFQRPTGPYDLDTPETFDADLVFATAPLPGMGTGMLAGAGGSGAASAIAGAGRGSATPPRGLQATGRIETGIASWYGPGFDGNATASGEPFDQMAMTAAHRTLPFGTWVKVTSAAGGSVFVRINDRGPFIAGRIIDLSKGASGRLGVGGTERVQVEVYA